MLYTIENYPHLVERLDDKDKIFVVDVTTGKVFTTNKERLSKVESYNSQIEKLKEFAKKKKF